MAVITAPARKVRGLLSVEAHRELLGREWLKQNRDELALLFGDRCLMADVVGGHRGRRPERHGALGFGEMLTNPGVPVHTGRNLLVPEHLKALRHESVANGTHALAVCTRIGEENICHAALTERILAKDERKLNIMRFAYKSEGGKNR